MAHYTNLTDGDLIHVLFDLCDGLGAITKPHELCDHFSITEDEARELIEQINAGARRHSRNEDVLPPVA